MAESYPPTYPGAGAPNPVHVQGSQPPSVAAGSPPPVQQPHTHERTDIATRPLWVFFAFFIVISILIQVGLYVLFFAYERSESELDKNRTRSAVIATDTGPPEPRLQGIPGYHLPTPREDQERMREEDRRRLTTYGRAQDGFARIPIDRAMDLVLERGLPVQQQQQGSNSRNAGGAHAR